MEADLRQEQRRVLEIVFPLVVDNVGDRHCLLLLPLVTFRRSTDNSISSVTRVNMLSLRGAYYNYDLMVVVIVCGCRGFAAARLAVQSVWI